MQWPSAYTVGPCSEVLQCKWMMKNWPVWLKTAAKRTSALFRTEQQASRLYYASKKIYIIDTYKKTKNVSLLLSVSVPRPTKVEFC